MTARDEGSGGLDAQPSGEPPLTLGRVEALAKRWDDDGLSEGTPVARGARCVCGTLAVGSCASCGRSVCGDHSDLSGHWRTCSPCRLATCTGGAHQPLSAEDMRFAATALSSLQG